MRKPDAKRQQEERIREEIRNRPYIKRIYYADMLGVKATQFTRFMNGDMGFVPARLAELEKILGIK